MTEDECTWFLAIDFDGDETSDWKKDISAFRNSCKRLGFDVSVERSRSGSGAHAWFFFAEKISAADARRFGSVLLTSAMENRHEIQFSSYDRLFPNQDTMPNGGFGNLIALPLQGQARKKGNSVFIDEQFMPYDDQWAYLSGIKKLSAKHVQDCIANFHDDSCLGALLETESENEAPEQLMPLSKKIPRVSLQPDDFSKTVRVIKSNMLHIEKNGMSQKALNRIKRLAAFKNPDFYKAQAMRLPTYGKPRIISASEENEYYLSIPRGLENELIVLFKASNTAFDIEDKTNEGKSIEVRFTGCLREDQQQAANTLLNNKIGVLQAATGFGKTVIASYIIAARKTNTLVLVHTSALLTQWKKSLSQFLEFDRLISGEKTISEPKKRKKSRDGVIGLIGGGKNTVGAVVDIAIMQSLINEGEVKDIVRNYGMVIIDECHHVSAFTFERILKTVTARYVYGLTATPKRQDGQQPIVFMQCGDIVYQVNILSEAKKHPFDHYVLPRFTHFQMPLTTNEKDFTITQIYSELSKDILRNKMIALDICAAVKNGRTAIVLTQRKEHAALLAEAVSRECENVILMTGNASAKEKRETMEKLASIPHGVSFVIVATGKLVGEGFDEPRLDTLFLASPIAWQGTLQQYAGRLHRIIENKKDVIVYDYIDIRVRMLENMYHKRLSGYAGMGYKALASSEKADAQIQKTGAIYESSNYQHNFEQDIENAGKDIIIASPYIRRDRLMQMVKLLSQSVLNGISVTIVARKLESAKANEVQTRKHIIQSMQNFGITFVEIENLKQKFAIFDRSIVWYGSVCLLSASNNDESIMRLENIEISGELFSLLKNQPKTQTPELFELPCGHLNG
jgi:superfamily II DNA or RNA helicase